MNLKLKIFQVSVRNRVRHKGLDPFNPGKPLRGKQGNWFYETVMIVASSESKAKEYIKKHIQSRRVLRKRLNQQNSFVREIQITEIEEKA